MNATPQEFINQETPLAAVFMNFSIANSFKISAEILKVLLYLIPLTAKIYKYLS